MAENFIVINGVRYDLVPDIAKVCNGCALVDLCFGFPEDFMLCEMLFECKDYHFKKIQ